MAHPLTTNIETNIGRKVSEDAAEAGVLRITEKAAQRLRQISQPGEYLRICVESGGCSGFEYKLSLDSSQIDEDQDEVVVVGKGATVVVDKLSLEFIHGSTLEFVDDLIRSAFRIKDNPRSTTGCSCGASFSPKDMV